MKNKVCIVVAITIALMVAQFGMLISSVKAEIITGSTGSEGDVSWSFDTETGTVTFSGSGVIYSSWDDRIQEKNVVSIIINAGITSMDSSAFENCYNLTSITVDIENENYSSENGILFNKDKTKIIRYSPGKSDSSYTIPNSVTTIDFGAFECCNNLTSITIPNSVTYIYRDAFRYCNNLTSVTIPNSVTSIGDWAFDGCNNLTNITVDIENENYSSENGILFNKDKTELICFLSAKSDSSYTIPNSVTSIGSYAFSGCNNLTSITIPNSVTSIGSYAFSGCDNLTSITIPNSVTSIGSYAFSDCYNLTSITIPNSVTSIDYDAFYRCTNLTSITVDIENKSYSSENGILFNKDKTEIIRYSPGKNDSSYTIPNSVTNIGSYAFSDCYNLTSVTIPNSVTSIGGYAFSGCDNLTSITIPNSVTSIGIYAFRNCDNLTIYCKSNSTALEYAVDKEITYQTDDNVPRIISLIQKGAYIKVEATDDGVGLDNKAYSIDGKNWYENNSIAIDESKTYTVYVKDKLGNIATKDIQIDITQPEITNISVEGHTIKVTATDNVALADKPYSIDGTNYQSSNEFTVMKEGTYTIYVKDAQGNVATKSALVTKVNDGDHDINDKDNENDDKSHNTNQDESENKDTTAPNITNISVEGYTIEVTATDNVGLADKAYSLDKENWQSSNEIVVTKTGRYMVYVKDKSGNIANKLVVVGDEKKGSNNSNKSELIAQQDNSQSKNKLPQTGNMSTVIICAIVIICIVCIIIFKRIKRMRF